MSQRMLVFQIAHNPWLSCSLCSEKKKKEKVDWENGFYSQFENPTNLKHVIQWRIGSLPFCLIPWVKSWNPLTKTAVYFPASGDGAQQLSWANSLAFTWTQEQQGWSFVHEWVSRCVDSNGGVNRRWAEGRQDDPANRHQKRQACCLAASVFWPGTGPVCQVLGSGRWSSLPFPSFVLVWGGHLALWACICWQLGRIFFFPTLFNFRFWHAQLRFGSDTPAGPLYAHSYWLFLKTLLLGETFFSYCLSSAVLRLTQNRTWSPPANTSLLLLNICLQGFKFCCW